MNNKLREALENSNGLLEELALVGEWYESAKGQIAENKAALAEPLRNCDVGTAEEQQRRFKKFCTKYPLSCGDCPFREQGVDCPFIWSQMPYEKAEEGGAE